MRILLLSCNTGGGHNSAAEAIRAHFVERGIECDMRDALLFVSKAHTEILSRGHFLMYRHFPKLFGIGYRFEEKHPPRFLYNQMALGAKKFTAFLKENAYDAIVCTHIFGNMLVTEARHKYGVTTPHYVMTTDYAMHPGTDMVDAARFFVAAEPVRSALIEAGIPADRVITSGIPVSPNFLQTEDKLEVRRRLGLPEEGKMVLLFSGSIGCGKLNRIAPELVRRLPADCTLAVLCGHNKHMYNLLQEHANPRLAVVGYTTRVAEYMAAADLCITKPGGLSTTEMLAIGLPMVLMLSVPGCETRNLHFFKNLGAAVGTDDWNEAIQLTVDLVHDDEQLAQMRARLLAAGYPGGAKVIADVVLADIAEENSHD